MTGSLRLADAPPKKLIAGAVLVAVGVLSSTACSSDREVERSEARALLDESTGQIVMPISEYDLTANPADIELTNRALYLAIGTCMANRGQEYSAAAATELSAPDDRTYGIWFEHNANSFGWGHPPNSVDEAMQSDVDNGDEAWLRAEDECESEALEDPALAAAIPSPEDLTDTLAASIITDSYRMASSDPLWSEAREQWWSCLREAGLEPNTDPTKWISIQSEEGFDLGWDPSGEAMVLLASTEARCNRETGLTQRLADLEASFQATLIAEHQAALNELKTAKQEMLQAARDYIATHG